MEAFSGRRTWRRTRRRVPVPNPAAGAEWSLTVPAGHAYQVRSIYYVLTASATVATRTPWLLFGDGAVQYLKLSGYNSVAASGAGVYVWAPGVNPYNGWTGSVQGLPELTLEPGSTITSLADNLQAGDQYSGIVLDVIDTEWKGGDVDLGGIPDLAVTILGG